MPPTKGELITAYRHLYQHLLRAVQYSKPARFVARDRLRDAFRNSCVSAYEPSRIATTLQFLDGAAKTAGLEHKVLKNVLHVHWERAKVERNNWARPQEIELRRKAYKQFDNTVQKLNETMGLCLR